MYNTYAKLWIFCIDLWLYYHDVDLQTHFGLLPLFFLNFQVKLLNGKVNNILY